MVSLVSSLLEKVLVLFFFPFNIRMNMVITYMFLLELITQRKSNQTCHNYVKITYIKLFVCCYLLWILGEFLNTPISGTQLELDFYWW